MFKLQDTIRTVQKESAKLQATADQLRSRLGEYHYVKVPGLVFPGVSIPASELSACQLKCNSKGSCTSFSFNRVTTECRWSSATISYDDNFVLYIKTSSVETFV